MASGGAMAGQDFFKFPFQPYESQLRLMQKIYEICEQGKIGICESPTGTGKSLSIICATMRWLEDFEKRESDEFESMKRSIADWQQRVVTSGDSIPFDEYAKQHKRVREQTEKLVDLEKQFERRSAIEQYRKATVETLAELEKLNQRSSNFQADMESEQLEALFGAQVGKDEKEEADLTNLDSGDEADNDPFKDEEARVRAHRVTVYYASRTHSQLAQFLGEFSHTDYAQRANVVVLGSRQSLCVNDSVRRLDQLSLINDACNELTDPKKQRSATGSRRKMEFDGESGKKARSAASEAASNNSAKVKTETKAESKAACRYYKRGAMETFSRYVLTHVTDIEDLCRIGRHTAVRACPYFSSKWAARDAQFVLVPYAILFNARLRRSFDLSLKDAVIVVDEAHNLLDALNALNSATVSQAQLVAIGDALRAYAARFQKRIAPRNLMAIRQLSQIIEQLINRLKAFTAAKSGEKSSETAEADECSETLNSFLFATKIDNLNLFELVRFGEQSRFWRKLYSFSHSRFYRAAAAERAAQSQSQSQSPAASTAKSSNLTSFLRSLQPASTSKSAAAKNLKGAEKAPKANEAASNSAGPSLAELTMSCFLQFESLLRAFTNADQDGRIILKRPANQSAQVRYVLLNPTECLVDVLKETRALVLCGGTMKPSGELVHLLSASLDSARRSSRDSNANRSDFSVVQKQEAAKSDSLSPIVEFSCEHVIPPDQLAVFAISDCNFGANVTFDFTFANRRDARMLANLGTLVEKVSATVPGGVVVFFQSYDYLDTVFTSWQSNGCLRRIEAFKSVLREPKQSSELDTVLNRYSSLIQGSTAGDASKTHKGAVLLCVVGGKLSEGINFGDDLGRCVMVVGLPFPNVRSVELRERVAYLNSHSAGLSGAEHCENVCMRAVNQSIGRAIRHRSDYATILLVDQRFSRNAIRQKLPNWIRASMQRYETQTRFDDALLAQTQNFFVAMAKRFAATPKSGKTN